MIYETYKEVYRSRAEGRSRFLKVFVTIWSLHIIGLEIKTED